MSETEKVIFDDMLPNRQMWYLVAGKKASDKAQSLFPNSASIPCNQYNGKGDSFRHACWNALSTKLIGFSLTEQLTTAHEEKPLQDIYFQKEKDMDLFNNQKGRIVGSNSTFSNVYTNVLNELNLGHFLYLTNLDVDCEAKSNSYLTPTNQ
jgi:hypothetical protein